MKVALWIIAACEVVRILQYQIQLGMMKDDTSARDDAYKAFVRSLDVPDREMVKKLLQEFEEQWK